MISKGEQKGRGWNPLLPTLGNNQTKIPYPRPLKYSNKTKLRLNESKNNSLKIYFLTIKIKSAKDNNFDLC